MSELRWHIKACTRCQAELKPGDQVIGLHARRYEPMSEGPDWECVGDWAPPLDTGAVFCSACVAALDRFLLGVSQ